ncbi:MAG: insulinase family protein [Bacteroidaceae bacterium]|nr:insulinase family protein [Bacteroidaceae bacterium]
MPSAHTPGRIRLQAVQMKESYRQLIVPQFPHPAEYTLPNGVPAYVIHSDYHEALRIDIVIGAGQWEQSKLLQALFTNRLLREGTARLTSGVLAEKLDYYGAWLELSVSVHHSFITLYTLSRFVRETCTLLRDMLLNPVFPEDRFEVIRMNNLQQHRVSRQRGDVMARRLLYGAVYGQEHPCGRFAEEEDFVAVSRDDLLQFYQTFYGSANSFVCLSGKVDDEALSIVAECFGEPWGCATPLPERREAEEPLPVDELEKAGRTFSPLVQSHGHLVQSSIRMGGLLMDVNSDDYYPMRVLCTILGGFFGSRLMKSIREDMGYTYGISADLLTNTGRTFFVVSSETVADKAQEVVEGIRMQMRRLQDELVPEAELTMVRNYMLGELCRNYEGAFAMADASIYLRTLGLPEDHIERVIDAIVNVSAEELRMLAQRWLLPERMQTVVVGP